MAQNYAALPAALGCNDWYIARVTTCGEFDEALAQAATADSGVCIKIITGFYVSSEMAVKLSEKMKIMYKS